VTGWLVDTSVLTELRRPRPEPKVVGFVAAQPIEHLFVSVVALAEIRFGIERVDDPRRRSELNDWLANRFRPIFEGRVLAVSEDVMLRRRLLADEGRKARHTFSQPDLIVAATALQHGLTIVARDVADYVKAGARTFNPWLAPAAPF
jgi:predicted nucleic acid-binding protein